MIDMLTKHLLLSHYHGRQLNLFIFEVSHLGNNYFLPIPASLNCKLKRQRVNRGSQNMNRDRKGMNE